MENLPAPYSQSKSVLSALNEVAADHPLVASQLVQMLSRPSVEMQQTAANERIMQLHRMMQLEQIAVQEAGAEAYSRAEIVKAQLALQAEKIKFIRDCFCIMASEVGSVVRETGRPFQMTMEDQYPGLFWNNTGRRFVVRGEFLD